MIHVFELPYLSAGEAGRSINFSIGLRLPGDVPSYPACEPAALDCSACAASNTAAPPTSGRWLPSPPSCRDGTPCAIRLLSLAICVSINCWTRTSYCSRAIRQKKDSKPSAVNVPLTQYPENAAQQPPANTCRREDHKKEQQRVPPVSRLQWSSGRLRQGGLSRRSSSVN
jgi:hypothetical protein